jgi:hypothetical protein
MQAAVVAAPAAQASMAYGKAAAEQTVVPAAQA